MKKKFVLICFFIFVGAIAQVFAGCKNINLDTSSWENPNLSQGYSYQGYTLEAVSEGLYLPCAPWKNGCKNNVCDGNYAATVETFNFQNGGDLYVNLVPDGAGKYMWFGANIESLSSKGQYLSTDHSWLGSYVIEDKENLFIHVKVNTDKTFSWSVCKNNYDDNGGTSIGTFSGKISDTQYDTLKKARIQIWVGDNYAGTAASLLVKEVKVCTNDSSDNGIGDTISDNTETCSNCEATYDFFNEILTIPCLKLDNKLYWLKLKSLHNGTLGIDSYGEK